MSSAGQQHSQVWQQRGVQSALTNRHSWTALPCCLRTEARGCSGQHCLNALSHAPMPNAVLVTCTRGRPACLLILPLLQPATGACATAAGRHHIPVAAGPCVEAPASRLCSSVTAPAACVCGSCAAQGRACCARFSTTLQPPPRTTTCTAPGGSWLRRGRTQGPAAGSVPADPGACGPQSYNWRWLLWVKARNRVDCEGSHPQQLASFSAGHYCMPGQCAAGALVRPANTASSLQPCTPADGC